MTHEVAFVVFASLVWGPTVLWLGYRALRGKQGRLDELKAAVGSEGFWVCGTCRSLNRPEANRCYHCRTAKDSAVGQAPGELPVGPGVPVMAESMAQPRRELPVGPGVPVMAESMAQPRREAIRATTASATPGNAPPPREILVGAPAHPSSAAAIEASAGTPVCPFLGLRDDPSTRFDFPDGANLCHAASGRGATSPASARRFLTGVAGTRRPEPIAGRYQGSHCLAAAHETCARYLAVEVLAANR